MTVARVLSEVLQVAEASVCVLLSVKVPVAVIRKRPKLAVLTGVGSMCPLAEWWTLREK